MREVRLESKTPFCLFRIQSLKMSDIPSELYHNILRRVPADALLRFRAVCKEWRRLIDDPSFIRFHADNQISTTTLLIRNSNGTRVYSLSLDSLNNINDAHQVIDVMSERALYFIGLYEIPCLPMASCNGLMLHTYYEIKEDWVLLNPFTREYHVLPPEPNFQHTRLLGNGLGYDSASDDYKVVRIDELLLHGEIEYQTSVYSLKTESWKIIEECPPCEFRMPGPSKGVYLNGALHWRLRNFVITLNLETECYHKVPMPPKLGKPFKTRLDSLGGCLVLSYYYKKKRIDGWLMKECGVEKYWVKLFSLGELASVGAKGRLRPIAYIQSKGQVFLKHDCGFFILDIGNNSAKKVTIDGLPKRFSCQIFSGSFIPLGDSYACEVRSSVGTKRKRKKTSKRSKHSVTITDV
ncbi:hypothetical protein ABFS82_10G120100 [Erythranthe guttata]